METLERFMKIIDEELEVAKKEFNCLVDKIQEKLLSNIKEVAEENNDTVTEKSLSL